jgi:predicted DNA-binding protein
MKLSPKQKAEKQIGGVRVSLELYDKLFVLADNNKCSVQEVIRAILEEVINEVE